MATGRASNRRGAAPVTISTPRPALSVEEWESRATLGDLAIKSVNALKAAGEIIPLPLKVCLLVSRTRPNIDEHRRKFSADEAGTSRPATPANLRATKIGSGSRPSTPTGRPANAHALHPKQPVQTPQQFYDWFALIDRSVAHSQESHFRAHVASVAEHLETCDRLIEKIDEVDTDVEGMLEGWRGVEEGGRSLKDACERLLQERVGLITPCLVSPLIPDDFRTVSYSLQTILARDWSTSRNWNSQLVCSTIPESHSYSKATSFTW